MPSTIYETSTSFNNDRIFVTLVSQVSLRVFGDQIFRECQERVLKWLFDPDRNVRGVPDNAWNGENFEILAENSEHVEAVNLDAEAANLGARKVWALRLTERFKDPGRVWTTEVGIAEISRDEIIFGCRLLCSERGLPKQTPRSIPRFVRGIVFTQDAKLDDRKQGPEPWFVDDAPKTQELADFIRSNNRKHPVVVFSLPEGSSDIGETLIDVKQFIRRTAGYVHSVIITSNASYVLTEMVGKEFSVYRQAIRTYYPGFDADRDTPTDHPVATKPRIDNWESQDHPSFQEFLIHQSLRSTRSRQELEIDHPPFQQIKRLAAAQARRMAKDAGQNETELLQLAEEEIKAAKQEAEENLGLLTVAEQERDDAELRLEQIGATNSHLRRRIQTLEAKLSSSGKDTSPEIPNNLGVFEEWCETTLSGDVELIPRAYRGVEKSKYEDVSLIYKSLLLLKAYYVPMRRTGGLDLKNLFEKKCQELGIEHQPTFSGAKWGEQGDTYIVRDEKGTRRLLDQHLKKGTGKDERWCFRLYFYWDRENERAVVGWLPSHLDTSIT